MQRVTISVDEALADAFDRFLEAHNYASRSEGVRDLVREAVRNWRDEQDGRTHCVADLSYIYDRDTRALAERLSEMHHRHHDLIISSHSVRLDHRHTMESVFLKGATQEVRAFAKQLLAERGVRFGSINLVGVDPDDEHSHQHDHSHHGHDHLRPSQG